MPKFLRLPIGCLSANGLSRRSISSLLAWPCYIVSVVFRILAQGPTQVGSSVDLSFCLYAVRKNRSSLNYVLSYLVITMCKAAMNRIPIGMKSLGKIFWKIIFVFVITRKFLTERALSGS